MKQGENNYLEWYAQSYQVDNWAVELKDNLLTLLRLVLKTSDAHDQSVKAYFCEEDYVIKKNQTWVITQNYLDVFAMPKGQSIEIKTKVVAANRFFITRQFIVSENNHVLLSIHMQFVAIDLMTRKMARLNLKLVEEKMKDLSTYQLPFKKLSLVMQDKCVAKDNINISSSDIDLNQHVNNLSYIKWALNSLPKMDDNMQTIEWMQIKYGSELLKEHQATIRTYFGLNGLITQEIFNETLQKESSLITIQFK